TSTDTLAEQEPTWSPDGTQIAFVAGTSDTDTTTDLEIWVMDADGSDLVQLTNTLQGVRDTQPAWSPDGNRFAFLSEGRVGDSNSNIYVMDANPLTNDASNLTDDDGTMTPVYQYNDEDPSWSPDGTQISYSTKADVWKMNAADGSGKVNLTTGNGGGSQPAWSPDGDSIVYVRGGDIYVMDNNGDNKTPVDTTLRKDEKPDWQPIPQCTESVSAANDPLTGTAGKDVLCGDALNNTINGAGGNDIILAQGGNDKLTGALGNDNLDGGPGTDTVLYPGSTAVRANLTTEFATGVGSDVLLGIENLRGSGASDRFIGSAAANALVGGAGADTLSGQNGNDSLTSRDGVSGNDTVNGGPGTDRCVTDASEALVASCP
ncbi:MAG: hypothetical protein ACRDTR_03740, partial [Rubrobacter sp.]